VAVASTGPYADYLQTNNHAAAYLSVFTGWMLFMTPNQQCQSTEGILSENVDAITNS